MGSNFPREKNSCDEKKMKNLDFGPVNEDKSLTLQIFFTKTKVVQSSLTVVVFQQISILYIHNGGISWFETRVYEFGTESLSY